MGKGAVVLILVSVSKAVVDVLFSLRDEATRGTVSEHDYDTPGIKNL